MQLVAEVLSVMRMHMLVSMTLSISASPWRMSVAAA